MGELRDNPDLMMEVLAKMVHKNGGYVKVSASDHPSGAFNLRSRVDLESGAVELMLDDCEAGTA